MDRLRNGGDSEVNITETCMKYLIKLEELGLFLLSILMFASAGFAWWWFPVLLFVPDISMMGYAVNSRIGAYCYNLFHHRALGVVVFASGYMMDERYLVLAGAVLFGHSAMDRIFGYGLKFTDSFKHTHLGRIGNK